MNVKGFSYRAVFSLLLATGMAASCTMYYVEEPITNREGNAVRLSLSVGNHEPSTKQSADITQDAEGAFREIDNLVIIPFATQGEVNGYDARLQNFVDVGTTEIKSLISGSNSVFYERVSVPRRTSSFLVYGKAKDDGSDKRVNGSLITSNHFYDDEIPSGITFSPDPICPALPAELETKLNTLITYLNSIANTNYNTYWWRNQNNGDFLNNTFKTFTADGTVISCSPTAVNAFLTAIYRTMNNNAGGTNRTNLRNAVRSNMSNATYVTISGSNWDTYTLTLRESCQANPADYGMPEGAVGLKWKSSENTFVPIYQTSTDGNIMSMDRYCYPANLWYYTNSQIKTSDVDEEKEHYVVGSTWGGILGEYNADNSTVYSNVTAVAVKEPLNYGVAHLEMKVKCTSPLKDNGGAKSFTMNQTSTSFPLTGVLVGQQRPVGYNFEPLAAEEYTVYDTQIGTQYLRTTLSDATHTLLLQTRKDEKVYLILEFVNNAEDFVGANGTIFKGMKFYLTGSIDPTNYTTNAQPEVFHQDYKTQVTFNVNSLENAWNIVPDLRSAQLEVGVQLQVEWIQATSFTGIMY